MSSHVKPKINYRFKEWTNCNYKKHGEVKDNKEKVNEYFGITFYFIQKVKVKIKMYHYVERMINDFPMKLIKNGMILTPPRNNIFEKGNRKRIGKKKLKSYIFQ